MLIAQYAPVVQHHTKYSSKHTLVNFPKDWRWRFFSRFPLIPVQLTIFFCSWWQWAAVKTCIGSIKIPAQVCKRKILCRDTWKTKIRTSLMIMTINQTNQSIKIMAPSTKNCILKKKNFYKKLYFKNILFSTKNWILKVFFSTKKRGNHCQKCQIPIFSQIWLKKTQKTD